MCYTHGASQHGNGIADQVLVPLELLQQGSLAASLVGRLALALLLVALDADPTRYLWSRQRAGQWGKVKPRRTGGQTEK